MPFSITVCNYTVLKSGGKTRQLLRDMKRSLKGNFCEEYLEALRYYFTHFPQMNSIFWDTGSTEGGKYRDTK